MRTKFRVCVAAAVSRTREPVHNVAPGPIYLTRRDDKMRVLEKEFGGKYPPTFHLLAMQCDGHAHNVMGLQLTFSVVVVPPRVSLPSPPITACVNSHSESG